MSASIIYTSRHSERQCSCCYLIFCCWRSSFAEHRSLISVAPRAMPVTVWGYMAVPWELRVALLTPLSLHVQPSQRHIIAWLISQDTGLAASSPDHQRQRRSGNANGLVCWWTLLGTWRWLCPATCHYPITADMGAVGNPGVTISCLRNEAQILLWDLLCITEWRCQIVPTIGSGHWHVERPIKIFLWNSQNHIGFFETSKGGV